MKHPFGLKFTSYLQLLVSRLLAPTVKLRTESFWNHSTRKRRARQRQNTSGIYGHKKCAMENARSRTWLVFCRSYGNNNWVTTAKEDGSELFAVCVSLESGKSPMTSVFDVANPQNEWSDLNTHATPTPIVEEGRRCVHYGTYGTACLDTQTGKKIWERRDLNCDHRVRPASSPVMNEGLLFLTTTR